MFKDRTFNSLWGTKCTKYFENKTGTMKLAFSLIRPPPAYLPLSSPLTSPLPFTSWTKSPLPFCCICLLAIIIGAVNHHRCSAVFSPTLLPSWPQSLLIVLHLHNLLSFPVYSELLCLFSYILHGITQIHLNSNAFHINVKSNLNISQVFPDSVAAVRS